MLHSLGLVLHKLLVSCCFCAAGCIQLESSGLYDKTTHTVAPTLPTKMSAWGGEPAGPGTPAPEGFAAGPVPTEQFHK
jgi:hypothetical protein